MQGQHRAADHLHAKPAERAPAQAAVPSSHIVQTHIMIKATRAAHTIYMAQIIAQAQARSRAQMSACSAHCCSASGIMPRTLILGTSSSGLIPKERCGGDAVNARMAILMPGKQVLKTGLMAGPAPFAQAGECVSTIHWPPSILTLLRSSVTETRAQLRTKGFVPTEAERLYHQPHHDLLPAMES